VFQSRGSTRTPWQLDPTTRYRPLGRTGHASNGLSSGTGGAMVTSSTMSHVPMSVTDYREPIDRYRAR